MAAKPQVRACLFDMDGLLLNTEDIYTEVTEALLAQYGKGALPWSVKVDLQGRPGPEAAKRFLQWSKLPLTVDQMIAKTGAMQAELWHKAKFMPGALELLQHLKANNVPIALATSSNSRNYELKTERLRHAFDLFGKHVVTGDDPRIPPGRGKPAPDIWLVALESINKDLIAAGEEPIAIEECLVFEDGVPGVQAGRAAGAHVVWVPDARAVEALGETRVAEVLGPHTLLGSLKEVNLSNYGLKSL